MILFREAKALHDYLNAQRKTGRSCGFVPTMGALHEGHLSLAKTCSRQNDICVVSIFINPTQFNDRKDFEKYPVTIEQDIRMLVNAGCDLLFLPPEEEIYPRGEEYTSRHFDLGYLEQLLEGKYRPGHFQGVCMVVSRLLDIVVPNRLYLGQKDYQQCLVIRRLIHLKKMDDKTELIICPTLREPDGLAMSSRNRRLNASEREHAASIYACLNDIKDKWCTAAPALLLQNAGSRLLKEGFRVDYVAVADAHDLRPVEECRDGQAVVALIAASVGEVRLIDNLQVAGN